MWLRRRPVAACVMLAIVISLGMHLGLATSAAAVDGSTDNSGNDPPLPPGDSLNVPTPGDAVLDWFLRLVPQTSRIVMV